MVFLETLIVADFSGHTLGRLIPTLSLILGFSRPWDVFLLMMERQAREISPKGGVRRAIQVNAACQTVIITIVFHKEVIISSVAGTLHRLALQKPRRIDEH